MRKQLEAPSLKLCLAMNDEQIESLWVRVKGQASLGDAVISIFYSLPDQDEEVSEAFFRQLKVVSGLQALVLMGDFNHSYLLENQQYHAHTVQEDSEVYGR